MPPSKSELADHLVDCLQVIGPVYSKRMFGGYGLFLDNLMFALIASATLYFKADSESIPLFEEEGMGPFTYNRSGKTASLSYYQGPEECLENNEELARWANIAYAAALRAAALKNRRKTATAKKTKSTTKAKVKKRTKAPS